MLDEVGFQRCYMFLHKCFNPEVYPGIFGRSLDLIPVMIDFMNRKNRYNHLALIKASHVIESIIGPHIFYDEADEMDVMYDLYAWLDYIRDCKISFHVKLQSELGICFGGYDSFCSVHPRYICMEIFLEFCNEVSRRLYVCDKLCAVQKTLSRFYYYNKMKERLIYYRFFSGILHEIGRDNKLVVYSFLLGDL